MAKRAAPFSQHTVSRSKPKDAPYELRDGGCKGLLLRVERTGTKSFYIVLRDGRRKLLGNAEQITLTQARDAAETARGMNVLPKPPEPERPSEVPTLGEFLKERYRPHFEMHHDSTKHLDNLVLFEKSPPGPYVLTHYRLDELTPAVLDDWLANRLKPKARKKGIRAASKATARRNLGALKGVLVQAVKWGVIPSSPLQHYSPIKQADTGVTRYLTPEEEKRLRDALDDEDARQRKKLKDDIAWVKKRYKDDPAKLWKRLHGPRLSAPWLKSLVLLALNTGARQGQLRKLEWRDVVPPLTGKKDNIRRSLTLRPETAKTKRVNHVALNEEAIEALRLMPLGDPTDAIFPGRRGKFLNNPNGPWKKLLQAARIEHFTFHCLRHSFASALVNEGVDLYRVQQALGHSTPKLTQRYAHLSPDFMHDAVDRLTKRRKGAR